jgi:YHS domain-containing protein
MEALGARHEARGARAAWVALLAVLACMLSGCGTTHATIHTSRGEDLMLLGYDPVGYFTDGKPVRGKHTIAATHEGRTYYFATTQHRDAFAAAPAKFETQYGGFCSNGAPYGVKMGSDPTQFEIRGARLFIFGDVQGHEMWLLDEADNIRHADQLWPSIEDKPWRSQSLKAWLFKVPWYRDGPSLMARWREKHPGQELNYDTGGTLNNVLFKYPGWRAREGYSQAALGVPGEPDDPLKGQ